MTALSPARDGPLAIVGAQIAGLDVPAPGRFAVPGGWRMLDFGSWMRLPAARLALVLLAAALVLLGAAGIAVRQPRFAVDLQPVGSQVRIATEAGRSADGAVVGVRSAGGATLPIDAQTLTPEPDVLPDYATVDRFFARQQALAEVLAHDPALIVADPSGRSRAVPLTPERGLPAGFWSQLLIGFIGFAISAGVWAAAPRRAVNILFGLTGAAMLAFVTSAAIYTTRSIALDGTLFHILHGINHGGALLFGAAMAALFLIYPQRIASTRVLTAIGALFAIWLAADQLRLVPSPSLGSQLATTSEMALIALAVLLQFFATRGDPVGRAALRWIGVATLFGAGLFVGTTVVPTLFGIAPLVDQGSAFAFFLLIHLGVAIGLGRERLFAIDAWAISLLFYGFAALLFLAVDMALVLLLGTLPAASAATGLLLLPLLYLPLRDRVTQRFGQRADVGVALEDVARVSLTIEPSARLASWRATLERAFAPLAIDERPTTERVEIAEDGVVLRVPGVAAMPGLELRLAARGSRLFKPADCALVARLVEMVGQVDVDRKAYERGIESERLRVSRDLHDDLAARLMGGLALDDAARLREVIRASLAEVRDIVSATLAGPMPVADLIADARSEAADRLDAAGIALDWPPVPLDGIFEPEAAKALASAMRELTTNVLKHSGAGSLSVVARTGEGRLRLRFEDNGSGGAQGRRAGNGLRNIEHRLRAIGGGVEFDYGAGGFRASLSVPVRPAS